MITIQIVVSDSEIVVYDPAFFEYLIMMQLVAIFLTVHDKRSAKINRRRVKESTLLVVSALGGSMGMLLTMKMIRHKAQKKKFMIGIPVIIVLQVAVYVLFVM